MMKKIFKKGQSLFEVVMAIGISAIIIVTLVSVTSNAIRNSTYTKNKSQATKYMIEAAEWLRSQRDQDISTFLTNSAGITWCISDLNWSRSTVCNGDQNIPNTPFFREVSLSSSVDTNGKTLVSADVKIYWYESGNYHEVRNVSDFSDWRER